MRHRSPRPYRRVDQLGTGTAEENGAGTGVRLTVWLRPPEPTVPGGRAGRGGLGFAHLAAAARVTAAGDPARERYRARAVPERRTGAESMRVSPVRRRGPLPTSSDGQLPPTPMPSAVTRVLPRDRRAKIAMMRR